MTAIKKISVTMPTLESHNHIVGDIERGVKIYKGGEVEFMEREPNYYWARVPHKGRDFKAVNLSFSHDGQDLDKFLCHCCMGYKKPPVCRHVVAAVLAIQGGIAESRLALGKTASVSMVVDNSNTAKAVKSGNLNVFATPMMIALLERAACECLTDGLESEQTSVGVEINVSHTAASPLGAEITATATIECILGSKIEFIVTASDKSGEIGKGKHTRVIVNAGRFMKRAETRK
jgi:predicted thioesterase